ncbi:MAG: YihA family ribosome biogenesis GTP-binding protein [Ectothiorhodospiraceae bacterium]|nr:YihA family ribosome biogenesis GTP-binding protein [Ectothiorhodospiraceae bacterium]
MPGNQRRIPRPERARPASDAAGADALLRRRLRAARFRCAIPAGVALPPDEGAEVAFVGRSNVGKSSAINRLVDQVKLARVARTPGRTRALNFFDLDARRRLVDLPGYGYAKVPEAERRAWAGLVERYLRSRAALRGVVLLMDVRRPLTPLDQTLLDWAVEMAIPLHVVLTKSDKLSRGAAASALAATRRALARDGASLSVQLMSSLDGSGVDALRRQVGVWLELLDDAAGDAPSPPAGSGQKEAPAQCSGGKD